MNKLIIIGFLTILLLGSLIVAGILLIGLGEDGAAVGKLYAFPISIGEKTYTISVRSNYSSSPEVSYFGLLKSVSVYFRGERGNAFCNTTVPNDLIWGELSVYKKDYKQSKDSYTLSSNSTHNSIYYTFSKIAAVEVVSIKGTEGVIPEFPEPIYSSPSPTA